MRKETKAVCSNDQARAYFEEKGLTYQDITEGDICVLVMLLNKHIKIANRENETSCDMRMSKKVDVKMKRGGLDSAFLYVNSHYFTQRECISFNRDGFIGFCGWADQGNTNPILRAFLEWCDTVEKA